MTTNRGIKECLSVSSTSLTKSEKLVVKRWLVEEAPNHYDSYEYCCLLGWWFLDNKGVPLSPKEAGILEEK